jgi:hypothetical protein
MPSAHLTGWITDRRQRVRFVPFNATVIACDPQVLVFNQDGHFFVPNLDAGKTYKFIARNGAERRLIRFTPRAGHNDLEVLVRTKPARIGKEPRRNLLTRQARG